MAPCWDLVKKEQNASRIFLDDLNCVEIPPYPLFQWCKYNKHNKKGLERIFEDFFFFPFILYNNNRVTELNDFRKHISMLNHKADSKSRVGCIP